MTVEHSEQAKAAFPNHLTEFERERGGTTAYRDIERTAFDRGRESALAERRITDRETLVDLLNSAQHAPMYTHTPDGDCIECPVPLHALTPGEITDAILALPSTPITSTREAVLDALSNAPGHVWDAAVEIGDLSGLVDAVMGALDLGLVKDNGDETLSPERRDARNRVDAALAEMTNRGDRLAVIREDWEYRAVACEPDTNNVYDSTGGFPTPEKALQEAERVSLLESNADLPQLVIGVERRRKPGKWESVPGVAPVEEET